MSEGLEQLQTLADRVVELVDARGRVLAPDAEVEANVLVSRVRHGLTRFANSFVHQHVGEDTRSVRLELAVDGRTSVAASSALDEHRLTELVDATIEGARLQPVDPHWPGATPPEGTVGPGHVDAATLDPEPEERAQLVREFVEAAPDLSAAGYVDTEGTQVAFASTAGQRAAASSTRATVDGIHQTTSSAGSAHQTSVALADLDGAAAGARAADRARRSEQFVDLDPTELEVVLGPEAVATVLTFLGVYGFNAKSHLEGASFVRLDEQQFDEALTLRNDPTDPRSIGVPFDAEGTPRRATTLVERGVSRALAHDRRTARRAGAISTGDGLPGGASMGAVPTSLVLEPGTRSPAQMVSDVERGLLVTQFHYCRVLDPKTLVVTGLTRNGTFLVEKGEVTGAVGNLRFTESFVDALGPGRVLGVGDDDRHADAEFGPGMVIAPSLHLSSWAFTGGASG